MKLTISKGRHKPGLRQLFRAWLFGYYGFTTSRLIRRRITFHKPATEDFSGKLFGRTRGIGIPFSRIRLYGWGELFMPAHEESDRFSYNCDELGVGVNVYSYRQGVRPYDVPLRFPDQSRLLAVLEYERPYILGLDFKKYQTKLWIRDAATLAVEALAVVNHHANWFWWLGKLQGFYVGGKEPASVPVSITMEHL